MHARRPHHHLGPRGVERGLAVVLGTEPVGPLRPGIAETRQVVVGIDDDRRDAGERRLLDEAAQQHGLAGAGTGDDRDVARQEPQRQGDGRRVGGEAVADRDGIGRGARIGAPSGTGATAGAGSGARRGGATGSGARTGSAAGGVTAASSAGSGSRRGRRGGSGAGARGRCGAPARAPGNACVARQADRPEEPGGAHRQGLAHPAGEAVDLAVAHRPVAQGAQGDEGAQVVVGRVDQPAPAARNRSTRASVLAPGGTGPRRTSTRSRPGILVEMPEAVSAARSRAWKAIGWVCSRAR